MFFLGIDSGTQGTKALVMDENGRILGRGYAPHQFVPGLRPGESEQDPQTWVEAMEKSISAALDGASKQRPFHPRKIVALGISGQQHGFVPLDQKGRVIRPAKLWNDTSTEKESSFIIQALGGRRRFIQLTGLNLAVGYTASKILWLRRHEPRSYRRLHTVLLPHNYLNFYLTGVAAMEYGDSSGTGLMDVRRCCWRKEVLEVIDPELASKLPPLRHPLEPVGYIKKEIASRFDLNRVLVASGGGDNMMGAIGTGNVIPGIGTLSLGTSGTVYAYAARPIVDYQGEMATFCDSTGAWLLLLCTMNVTNVTEQARRICHFSLRRLEGEAQKAPPGAEGLLFLPFLDGERVPILPSGCGVFFGLNRRTFHLAHLIRAIYEGVILNLGYGFRRLQSLGLKPSEIRATGGGSRSRLWLEISASVLETPIHLLEEQEGAAYGAALQALWTYLHEQGEEISLPELVTKRVRLKKEIIEPQPQLLPLYRELQTRYNSLWHSLRKEFEIHRLWRQRN